MSTEDNQIKAQHGVHAKHTLDYVVVELEKFGAIKKHENKPSYGYENHDKRQFKADMEITASDGTVYILYTTNSIRSDRVKGEQWDASNIKQIEARIEQAYLIVPDEDALKGNETFRDKLRNGTMYSAIDDILTVDEFYESEIAKYGARLEPGVRHDLEGRKFEELFSTIMGSQENLNRFNGVGTDIGYLYEVFITVMEALDCHPGTIKNILASTDIPKLPSGGSPKTDVALEVTFNDGISKVITFSLKDSSNKSVSVHQYSADSFASVLDPTNKRLRELLNEFQTAGSAKAMRDGTADELKSELAPYLHKLDKWVFSGYGPKDSTEIQCAQYLVTKSKGKMDIRVHEIDLYCKILEENNNGRHGFGTIFSWTYASGQRGKSIQLKAKIVP